MSDTDFVSISKSLARRYKNTQQFDDLVSEGVLACYEAMAAGKTEHAEFVGVARRAMNDYINVKTKAMSIPTSSWTSRAVSQALAKDEAVEIMDGVSSGTLLSLVQAMSNVTENISDDTAFTVDHADVFEKKEYHDYVISVVKKTLSATEIKVIELRYFMDMTQDDVAITFGVDQSWVSRHENAALGKLKKKLVTIRDA